MDPNTAKFNVDNSLQNAVPEGDALNDDSAFLTKKQVVSAGLTELALLVVLL